MSDETLEDKVKEVKNEKFSLWDFLVSAYSSSKGVKVGLLAAAADYSYPVIGAMSAGFYLSVRTLGTAVKHLMKLVNPMKYFSIKEMMSETIKSYNPFGKYIRPTFMGATLSGISYATGF